MEKIYSFTSKSFGHKETCGHKFAVMNPTPNDSSVWKVPVVHVHAAVSFHESKCTHIFHSRLLRAKKKNPQQAAEMAV